MKNSNIINQALDIINTHTYKICELCQNNSQKQRNCKEYCLPVEMFVQMINGASCDLNKLRKYFSDQI